MRQLTKGRQMESAIQHHLCLGLLQKCLCTWFQEVEREAELSVTYKKLSAIDPFKSLESDKSHLSVLRKLGVSFKGHSLSQLEIHGDQKKHNWRKSLQKSQKAYVGNCRLDNPRHPANHAISPLGTHFWAYSG